MDPLSTVLRLATWGAHEEVESGPREEALANRRLAVDVYADLLAQSWAVFRAIEAIAPRLASDPIAGAFVRPEVFRTEHVERDLTHYWGPSWRERVDLSPETQFYVQRIETRRGLDLDTATAVRLIEEALVAYQCNISLNDALVVRHGDVHVQPAGVA